MHAGTAPGGGHRESTAVHARGERAREHPALPTPSRLCLQRAFPFRWSLPGAGGTQLCPGPRGPRSGAQTTTLFMRDRTAKSKQGV